MARHWSCQRGLLWRCRSCGHDTSVTAGTVLHRTRVPLTQWFWAAYLVSTQTPGFSALQLQRQLGLRRYETAWAMLQKLRRAMVRPERELLKEKVEVDETYIGGPEAGLRGGRHVIDKAIVVGAVEVRGKASGRVRLKVVPDVSAPSLIGFVKANRRPRGGGAYRRGGEPTTRSPSTATATGLARRAILGWRARSCPASTGCSGTSRPGCGERITASGTLTFRPTSTSSFSQPPAHADGRLPNAPRSWTPATAHHLQAVV